ncbi:hypothetical protein LJ707_15815 [Mucilaginibacter sp. UR6-1]|uniref:hypothetical protein n=1 Tax=Mucilaginibacter sp. UR6-1 TaxID=1435643 RepID=UPI001E463509|nr:hypothetical protein [Mucilaginibacter sp. UR6-1]MCC8410409.1 hypothetical protein [Mucilaginibacter sp. UR6-1]
MKKLFFTPIIIFIAFFNLAQAQDSTKKATQPQARTQTAAPQNTDRSLNGQYRYLLTKTYNYQQPVIGAFYRNVMDTIKTERAALRKAQATVNSQAATIKKLNVDVTIKDETISASNAKMDQINLLGIGFTKAAYNTLMWGLVLGFGIALAIVIITTTRFRHEAKYRIKLYNELSEEFQTYKTKANEKEKKLARELQTERNKLDELSGR